MPVTRRQFLLSTAVGAISIAAPAWAKLAVSVKDAATGETQRLMPAYPVLNRIAYGPDRESLARYAALGFRGYVEEQLRPEADAACDARLARATLHIEYKASDSAPEVNEDRPLLALGESPEQLWKRTDNTVKLDGRERNRPLQELKAATWIRAVHSPYQLQELMVEFWHNHFNVNAQQQPQIAVMMPPYDAVMRRHCLGNFRALLEEVAQSTAMQFYLNNVKSKASPANENYARELFELHTLGADHYYNNLYNRWREVPGALAGKPIGYIDQDVYEAARAFTGWTIEDGANTGRGVTFPKTGKFTYFDGWHDNYQKRVLGTEFDPNAGPMADGRRVLDLVAAHPGTALHLAGKLCRRFVSDNPPAELVKQAAAAWQKHLQSPDQIAQVLRVILYSDAFAESLSGKVKRPYEYAVSLLRAVGAEMTPTEALFGALSGTGYRMFEWQPPTGHPDVAEYWLNSNTTLSSWNLASNLLAGNMKAANVDLALAMPRGVMTQSAIAQYWMERLTGGPADANLLTAFLHYMPNPAAPNAVVDSYAPAMKNALHQTVMTIAMLPEFQRR